MIPTVIEQNFNVVRLVEADVKDRTDHFHVLRDLILENEPMYPKIGRWVNSKVIPGLRDSERVAFVGYFGEKPVASCVVKRGTTAKFCHLKISEEFQNAHLGEVFFALMANEVRDLAKSVYFTLPESLWATKKAFFQSFHFCERTRAEEQYRLFDEELHCRASFAEVWRSVAEKLPKILEMYSPSKTSFADDLLLSVRPQYLSKIFAGTKRIEIRRKFSTKWHGHTVNLYASGPTMQIMGHARVSRIVVKPPEQIWEQFKHEIGCSFEDFNAYTVGASEIYALELDDVTPFRMPISRTDAASFIGERLVPPQSYCTLEKNKPWAKALSVASFLQGAFRGFFHPILEDRTSPRRPLLCRESRVLNSQVRSMFA